MKFMVGYQLTETNRFRDLLVSHSDSISEIYFPWSDMPNGRNPFTVNELYQPWEAQQRLVEDLEIFSRAGLGLNLLLNGNCYGQYSLSKYLFQTVGDIVDYIGSRFAPPSVTTTSPLIARFIHQNFEGLEVRASVNMDIGTTQGMDYVADVFDGFYLQREFNRNEERIVRNLEWCRARGKKLYLLANSGCLNDCSAHVFHDNLVAHENEIRKVDNAVTFKGVCWDYLKNPEKWVSLIRDESYVRPEDIALYDDWFPVVKLATRTNALPERIVSAYLSGRHAGNTLDLLEPNHSGVLYPYILDNQRFPADFAKTVLRCDKRCDRCGYCASVLEQVLVNAEEYCAQ